MVTLDQKSSRIPTSYNNLIKLRNEFRTNRSGLLFNTALLTLIILKWSNHTHTTAQLVKKILLDV